MEIIRNPLWASVVGCWTGVLVSSPSSESWSERQKPNPFSYAIRIRQGFSCLCSSHNDISVHVSYCVCILNYKHKQTFTEGFF